MEEQYYNPKTGKVHIKQSHRYRHLIPDDDEKKMFRLVEKKILGTGRHLNKWLDTQQNALFYCGSNPRDNQRFSYQDGNIINIFMIIN